MRSNAPSESRSPKAQAHEEESCAIPGGFGPEHSADPPTVLGGLVARNKAAKDRLAQLARAIESDVIPRLVQAHRQPQPHPASQMAPALSLSPNAAKPLIGPDSDVPAAPAHEVSAFVALLIGGSEAAVHQAVSAKRQAGVAVETLYLQLFSPAARELGDMWDDDRCDFATVTVALGRLQGQLRSLSPSFGAEVEHPANGRRALFAQPAEEQHSFGVSMVAEFFRREGWDVTGVHDGDGGELMAALRNEWFDMVGFSVGTERRLEWLRQHISQARKASRNPTLVVMVGGPLLVLNPGLLAQLGADGTAQDAKDAPRAAARLLMQNAA